MASLIDIDNIISSPAADLALQHEVQQFYYREALLLDNIKYEDWFALLDDDIHYYMPIRRNRMQRYGKVRSNDLPEYTNKHEFAHFDDDKTTMNGRLRKLLSDYSWSENPASRTRHTVSNVIITEGEEDNTLNVCSSFIVYRNRLETQVDLFAGERHDVLRRSDNALGFKIAKRTVLLDQSTILSNNISIFF
ncbi:MAG: benzene 1,2-dioxygenase [Cycloclasticus sp. Phe_18]|jgi:biphenyl 2,3-dioxygenase beta subunit|nr:MAG: benzene 1,2-dioxygenase [Cycloclasticus sp. Phe_18]MDF1689370.1 aromatic-ring-hydroxylating dioxygenase subunit beta [Cycloclasticus sp.]